MSTPSPSTNTRCNSWWRPQPPKCGLGQWWMPCIKQNQIELKMVQALHELATEHFLIQQIELPTHWDGNVLDVLFTNNSNLVHSYTCTYSGQSDHNIVEVKSHYKTTSSHKEQPWPEVAKQVTASFFSLNFWYRLGENQQCFQISWLEIKVPRIKCKCYVCEVPRNLFSYRVGSHSQAKAATPSKKQNCPTSPCADEDQTKDKQTAVPITNWF